MTRRAAGAVVGLCVAAAAGVVSGITASANPPPSPPQPQPQERTYELQKNSRGQTYGSSDGNDPDLIQVIGNRGKIGYVRKTDLDEIAPKSPAEALARQKAQASQGNRVVRVYDSEGERVIDTFTIQAPKMPR